MKEKELPRGKGYICICCVSGRGQKFPDIRKNKKAVKWEIAWFIQEGTCGHKMTCMGTMAGHVVATVGGGQIVQGLVC